VKITDNYVCGPEEGHIVINDKFYLVDIITNRNVKIGDFIQDKWGYTYVKNILDITSKGYTLFQGYELKKEEYRERMIKKIIE